MRGIDTPVRQRRRRVFKEVANLAYHSTNLKDDMEALPYKIVDYEKSQYWESVYRDRAIIRERLRLAMGMSLRPENRDHPGHLTEGLEESNIDEKYYEPPLMQVIPSACNACPENRYEVTNSCMGCLAHPCQSVCPKGAISMVDGRSVITSDPGVYAALAGVPELSVLKVRPGFVSLPGYGTGFIGGASGRVGDEVVFNGDLSEHPDFRQISAFIAERGLRVKHFPGLPLTDVGSIIEETE